MSKVFKSINILLSIALVLIAAGIAYIALPIFGNQALIVRSGSMAPAADIGSIIVTRAINQNLISPIADSTPLYNSGDIIAFRTQANSKTIVTHRIVEVEAGKAGVFYQTKGDANEEADGWSVSQQNILGKVYFILPYLGLLLAFAKSKLGFALLIIFPASIVILMEFVSIFKEIRKKRRENFAIQDRLAKGSFLDRFSIGRLNLGLKVLIPILAFSLVIPFALAFLNDTETSTGNVFQAASVFATPTPTPPPIAQTLVMNEVLPFSSCNSGQTNGQFVELWNGSGAPVDLQQFSLSDGTNTIAIANSNTSLPAGAFAILVKSVGVINQCLGGNVNGAITVNLGGNIDLNTGLLKLIDTNGITVLDRVEFGASNSGALQTVPDQSIERNLLGLDSALGDTFAVSDFGKQCPVTPGAWVVPTGTCPVVINELMWMGSSNDTIDEWLELRNMTSSPINLAGWVIRGASSIGGGDLTILSGTISANGFFLISNFAETSGNSILNITPDFVTTNVQLDNTNAQYILVNSLGKIVDTADDDSLAPLAGINNSGSNPDSSMQRRFNPGNGMVVGSWLTATTSANFDLGVLDKGTPKTDN